VKDFFVHIDCGRRVTVGGVTTLADFSPDTISVRVSGGVVTVNGKNLVIERFDENEIIIAGTIKTVETNVR
jgi:sporulation protein YqfC